MDLKLLLLFSILAISVYGVSAQDELPDPPEELVNYLNELSRKRSGGRKWKMDGKWEKLWEKMKECAKKRKNGEKCTKSKDPENPKITDEHLDRFMTSDFEGFLAESRQDRQDDR